MGLAGPKKRAKLSHDPNNTAWSRNTESFGHKILASQGWAPGDTLGARGALHADHYTAGSNSHIRVALKDNQLGLGAKMGGNSAETFGLSLFSGILGRLNGKSDVEVEKEQRAQKDVELALYQSRKLGHINFVSAGFLVGDRIEEAEVVSKDQLKKAGGERPAESVVTVKAVSAEPAGTKRKRGEVVVAAAEAAEEKAKDSSSSDASSSEDDEQRVARKAKKSKKEKKEKKDKSATATDEDDTAKATKRSSSSSSKSKKDRKTKSSSNSTSTSTNSSDNEDRAAKKARKAERRAQKEERRKKKEARRAAKSASASVFATPVTTAPATPAEPVSGSSTPQAAATPFIGRHAVRQRYIAAKGRAHLDPQALKEIFMVKA